MMHRDELEPAMLRESAPRQASSGPPRFEDMLQRMAGPGPEGSDGVRGSFAEFLRMQAEARSARQSAGAPTMPSLRGAVPPVFHQLGRADGRSRSPSVDTSPIDDGSEGSHEHVDSLLADVWEACSAVQVN